MGQNGDSGGRAEGALSRRIGEALRQRGLTLAVAESCTGGGLGDSITDVEGSSDYFLGGVISYANGVKERLLGVPASELAEHGAVSPKVAAAMAEGARRLLGADLALAVTGIAGPSGGTAAKPVGLVYVALAWPAGTQVERHQWSGSRRENKRASVQAALALLARHLGVS
ncbi:MAG: CinA family protein [Anaerolineae bacterium]